MWKKKPNSQYNVASAESLPVKIAGYQRRKMYQEFINCTDVKKDESILDVGVTSDQTYDSSNYLEAWYPEKSSITAVGIDDARFLEEKYKGVTFVQANGLDMPFENQSFDVVHSSAVLEHVGSFENQVKFIAECARVSKRHIFLTTPNRWFPVEFHTVLPLVHWLPKSWFRWILKNIGMELLSKEENLNLLTNSDLQSMIKQIEDYEFKVYSVPLFGWASNLILVGRRL